MEFFIIVDLTVFIILALCLLIFCIGVIGNIEAFVLQNMDTLLIVAIILSAIIAIASTIIVAIGATKKKGIITGVLSLLSASQFVAYLYFGLTGIAGMGFWRILAFVMFVIYGIINLGAYLYAHLYIIVTISSDDDDGFYDYLAPILVFIVGWLINLFLFPSQLY